MSKNMRVLWKDLRPGDLLHLTGSPNVYPFIRWAGRPGGTAIIRIGGLNLESPCWEERFSYATRVRDRWERMVEPEDPGEYWVQLSDGDSRLIITPNPNRRFVVGNRDRSALVYRSWHALLKNLQPIGVFTAQQYYQGERSR